MDHTAPLIYVVEDNDGIRGILEEMLSDAGYEVLGCRTAHEAWYLIHAQPPDLVVLDNHLEDYAAGWHLLTQLRAHATTSALPIILISVDAAFLRIHCADLNARRCLVIEKPFDLDDLLTTVYAALGVAPAEQGVSGV